MTASPPDWVAWHAPYDESGSPLERRLRLVQEHIAAWLGGRHGQLSRVISVCAGQGRDVLPVLASSADGQSVRARLVELDPANASAAEDAARTAGLTGVDVVCADAGTVDAFFGAAPADLVLLCGVLGNISDEDVHRTVACLPQLCAADATLIWTRSRRQPDLTPSIRSWLADAGFEEVSFDAPADVEFSVGVHRFVGTTPPWEKGLRLFRFL